MWKDVTIVKDTGDVQYDSDSDGEEDLVSPFSNASSETNGAQDTKNQIARETEYLSRECSKFEGDFTSKTSCTAEFCKADDQRNLMTNRHSVRTSSTRELNISKCSVQNDLYTLVRMLRKMQRELEIPNLEILQQLKDLLKGGISGDDRDLAKEAIAEVEALQLIVNPPWEVVGEKGERRRKKTPNTLQDRNKLAYIPHNGGVAHETQIIGRLNKNTQQKILARGIGRLERFRQSQAFLKKISHVSTEGEIDVGKIIASLTEKSFMIGRIEQITAIRGSTSRIIQSTKPADNMFALLHVFQRVGSSKFKLSESYQWTCTEAFIEEIKFDKYEDGLFSLPCSIMKHLAAKSKQMSATSTNPEPRITHPSQRIMQVDIHHYFQTGMLSQLNMATLKHFCAKSFLSTSGVKDDILVRLEEHLQSEAGNLSSLLNNVHNDNMDTEVEMSPCEKNKATEPCDGQQIYKEDNEQRDLAFPLAQETNNGCAVEIRRANFHQGTEGLFPQTGGTQCTAICLLSIVAAWKIGLEQITDGDISDIVLDGDQLHQQRLVELGRFTEYNCQLDIDELPKTIKFQNVDVAIGLRIQCDAANNFQSLIQSCLQDYPGSHGFIVRVENMNMAVIIGKNDKFGYFDPHSRDDVGCQSADGTAIMMLFNGANAMINYMKTVLNTDAISHVSTNQVDVAVVTCTDQVISN